MSVTPDTETRANRHGSKCPDWCHIDHATPNMHTGRVIDVHISAAMADNLEYPRVNLTQDGVEHGGSVPQVHVASLGGFVFVSPEMAGDLAGLIQSLADCTPERLRDLADEIRIAASALT